MASRKKKSILITSERELKSPAVAEEVQVAMRARGINPRQFAAQIGKAYDHVRKVYNGEVFPGPNLLNLICKHLDLDPIKMKKLIEIDKAYNKGVVADITGEDDPFIMNVRRYQRNLTNEDQDEILEIIKLRSQRNIRKAGV